MIPSGRWLIFDVANMTRNVLRKLIRAVAIVAMLTGAAAAQMPMPSMSLQGEQKRLTPEEKAKQKAIDDAYRSATNKIPEQKVYDPWADVRPAPNPPNPPTAPKTKQSASSKSKQ